MAGRPGGMSEDDTDSEDDFFAENSQTHFSKHSNNNHLKSRPWPSKKFGDFKEPVARSKIDLDEFRMYAMKGNVDKLKEFLSTGVPVDQILRSGWTALMYAASSGQWKVVEYLMGKRADPNFHKELFTPLMAACASSHENENNVVQTVEILLKNGAKINATERHGISPLMFATKERRLQVVKTLLSNGADPNVQDNRGWTALMWAAERGDGAIVRELMEHGNGATDPNLLTNSGQKAVDIALAANHKEVAALLDYSYNRSSLHDDGRFEPTPEFTELETTLLGLDLSSLIPVFQKHKMDYYTFLLLDEPDLDMMDIKEVGHRTKLLSAIKESHTKEWKRSSLPAIQYSKYLSCPEATSLMGNLALHTRYMEASVTYLRDQIQRRPRILQLGMQTASVHSLYSQTQYALKHVQGLQDQLRYLKQYLEKVQDKAEFIPADLITEKVHSKASSGQSPINWVRYVALLVVVLSGSVALWRKPALLSRPSTILLVV